MKSDHSLEILEKKEGSYMSSRGRCRVAGPGKLTSMGGGRQRWRALNSATSEHPAGLWPCDKLADSKLNLDLLLQTLFWTTGLSDKRK